MRNNQSKSKHETAFDQSVIALIWDFDKTLIQGYMQAPLFQKYKVDSGKFWSEVRQLKEYYEKQSININNDAIYLNHILTYVKSGKFGGLNNQTLFELGQELEFYPGLPDFFSKIKNLIENDPKFKPFNIKLEHYIVSTGFAQMIRGCKIGNFADGIWGCEFIEDPAPPDFNIDAPYKSESPELSQVALALDNTSKTRALFEINKGANTHNNIDVNSKLDSQNRRVPFENMIYIADGPSDVPAFSILNQFGGSTYAIYPRGDSEAFNQVDQLRKDNRISMFGEADYTENSTTYMWLVQHSKQIAQSIINHKEDVIKKSASAPPIHL